MKKTIPVIMLLAAFLSTAAAQEKTGENSAVHMEKMDTNRMDPVHAVSLIGTRLGDQVNFMTCAWFSRLEVDPYLFGISIQKQHFTHRAIMENKCFSLNIPAVDLIPRVDAVGMVSGREYDKSGVFDVFYGENDNSPMVDGSIVSLECEVVQSVSLVEADAAHPRAHTLFIAEVKNVWVHKNAVKNNALDYETLKPVLWTMSPNSYWTLGENQGRAFNRDHINLVPKKTGPVR